MLKVVSGGQTGVDQGALAAALESGIACGGWCPEGRMSEHGPIPAVYPLVELAGAGYRERTLRNVLDSDGTAILYNGDLEGGTRLTRGYCEEHDRPFVLIDAANLSRSEAVAALVEFVTGNGVRVLNVAGPRASKWAEAFAYARGLLIAVLDVAIEAGF